MNWSNMDKTADFWKAWQDSFKSYTANANPSNPMQVWWEQQEQFWRKSMEQTGSMFNQQPDLARQWQSLQSDFLRQWQSLASAANRSTQANPVAGITDLWKSFADRADNWYAEAFRNKLPEQLKPHFQTYYDMYRMFASKWEDMQGLVRNGLTEPQHIWQWVNPAQYGSSIGKIMGFKPIGDLEEVTRQANRFFEQLRSTVVKMIPVAEERMFEMGETMQTWSQKQADHVFPFMHAMQDVFQQQLEPYFQTGTQDQQSEVLRKVKDLHFAYISYLNNAYHLQRMVLDAGAGVLPEMLVEARKGYEKDQQLPEFDAFFREYMNRLEEAALAVMHTDEYNKSQNAVLKAGATSKHIYNEIMEVVLKDWPFLTKKEADDLAKDTAELRRKIRKLEARLTASTAHEPKPAPRVKTRTASVESNGEANTPANPLLGLIGAQVRDTQDDLRRIKGIGEKLAQTLQDMGVRNYEQIARMNEQAYALIDDLIPAFKGRAKRDAWADQAKALIGKNTIA
jgi:predicted flap endonuclease-1-like 5' DNA nuclease